MTGKSQNGWAALVADSKLLHRWRIPTNNGVRELTLRNGSAGFLLCHFALYLAEKIEPITGGQLDDWGYAYRPIRGDDDLSNHASGTAVDLNALQHPLGVEGTWTKAQEATMRRRLEAYRGCIRAGFDYSGRVDPMHFEINRPLSACEERADSLMTTTRGRRLLEANPGQRAVILSRKEAA